MRLKLEELKLASRRSGRRITWEEISEKTGIGVNTLNALNKGSLSRIRCDYIDGLCDYFEVTIDELVAVEPIKLPIKAGRIN